MMARIIGIVNLKGGVGKTTTCVNLGAALAQFGFKVLLVDLDPQKSLTGWAGLEQWPTISNILTGEVDPYQALLKWSKAKCWIVPAGRDLRRVENQLLSASQREYILRQKLERFFDFDFILIDSAPSAGLLTINAICASHEVIIPLQTEILALESTIPFFETLGEIKKRFHTELKIAGILPNMFDARTNLSKSILDQMRASEHLGPLMFKTVIRKNVKLAETPSLGYAITRYSASHGAADYSALADEILNDKDRAKIEAMEMAKARDKDNALTLDIIETSDDADGFIEDKAEEVAITSRDGESLSQD
jgi:chromosome partitioning protein